MIEDIEHILVSTLSSGIAKRLATEIWENIKGRVGLPVETCVNLKELRDHLQASVDILNRIIDQSC